MRGFGDCKLTPFFSPPPFPHPHPRLVKIPAATVGGGVKAANEFCGKFWTFNCDGKTKDKECMKLNARVCAPSKKKRDRCSLQKSKASEGMYKQCKPTEEQVNDMIRDFEADDTFDNWFAGTCEDGDGSKVMFKTPAGEDKEVDACAVAKASAERR